MKNFLLTRIVFCTTIFLLITTLVFAESQEPRRIAILPTINESSFKSTEAEASCDAALYESLRIPLNAVLKRHEYISKDNIITALPELNQPIKRHSLSAYRLREAAETLNADLIVGFIITDAEEIRHFNWDGDMVLYSYTQLRLIGYDRRSDSIIKLSRREFYNDYDSPQGQVEVLIANAADYLLKKADFKKAIFPIK